MPRLRVVVAPTFWRALASAFAALGLLIAGTALVNLAHVEYFLYSIRRVQLQILNGRADTAVWAAAMVVLALVLKAWHRPDRHTLALAILSAIAPILLLALPSSPTALLTSVGALLTFVLVCRLVYLDREFLRVTWFFLAAFLVIIESFAFAHWVVFPFYSALALRAADFEVGLAYSGYGLVTPLVIVLILLWVPLFFPGVVSWIPQRFLSVAGKIGLPSLNADRGAKLLAGLWTGALAVLVGYYPYLRLTTRLVGGDIDCCYMPTLSDVLANGLTGLEGSDRVLFYAVLYVIHLATGASAYAILMILPAMLSLFTAGATFVMVRLGLRDFWTAISAAAVSAVSFNTTAAIFMDLFANWFANALLLVTLGLLVYVFRGGSREKLATAICVAGSVLVFFSHALVWWSMLAIVAIFGTCSIIFTNAGRRRKSVLLTALFVANIFCYQSRLAVGTSGTMLDAGVVVTNYSALAWGLVDGSVYGPFWSNLAYFVDRTAVFYANWILIGLVIVGTLALVLRAKDEDHDFRWLLGAWMLVGAALTVALSNILNPYYSQTSYMPLVWRGLFMIPIQVPAGIALGSLLGYRSQRIAYVLLLLVLVNFGFHTLALTIIV